MAHEEEILGKAYDSKLMKRLLKYLRPYRTQVVLAIVMTIVVSALGPLRPYLVKIAIDDYIAKSNLNGLSSILLLLVGSVVLQALVQYAQTIGTQWIGQKTIYDLRKEVFTHIQSLGLRFYDKNPVGRLVTRLTSDIEVLNELFSAGIIMIFADVFVLVWIFAFMFYTNWELALIVSAVFPLLIIATSIFRKKAREMYREVRLLVARMNSYLNEHFSGMLTVQLFGRERQVLANFEEINRAHADANIRSVFYYAVFYPFVEFVSSLAFALILWFGGAAIIGRTLTAGETLSIGTLVAFIQYTEQFFRPVRDLSEKYNILQGAMASSERLFRLLDDETVVPLPTDPIALPKMVGEIEFRNVWFAYNNEDWVLRNVSFRVKSGETVAFVGATGAGKSSITNLICRFYEFQRGEILIDGVDIRQIDPHALRKNVAIVLQDVFLFSTSVEENISLGNPDVTAAEIEWSVKTVGADEMVGRLPNGLQTQVQERGAVLSVGEKQLISFARALAHKPAILILDEATSSIDTHSEELIQTAIERLLDGRTSVVVAHRLSTIRKANSIIVMHKGEIREQGSHEALMNLRGIYRTLYELQYKEQELLAKSAA